MLEQKFKKLKSIADAIPWVSDLHIRRWTERIVMIGSRNLKMHEAISQNLNEMARLQEAINSRVEEIRMYKEKWDLGEPEEPAKHPHKFTYSKLRGAYGPLFLPEIPGVPDIPDFIPDPRPVPDAGQINEKPPIG
jgi:hypothetical protein